MLLCLGTAQAWSVYAGPLKQQFGLTSFQTQFVFSTSVLVFCFWMIVGGRFQDRLGPRPVALTGSAVAGLAYFVAYIAGDHFFFLWLGMGLLYGVACATVYTCPIATAIKWFPRHQGLVAGLSAAAFGCGPIVVQAIATPLLKRGWPPLNVIGLIGLIYTPILALTSLLMSTPVVAGAARAPAFRWRTLMSDRLFWVLFTGMLCGTFPYLLVMGNVRSIAAAWDAGFAIALGIPAMAIGNSAGRIFWGYVLDAVGTRTAMRSAQGIMILSAIGLILSKGHPPAFALAAAGIGFCYGSNFAIYPGTVARVYGAHLLGSVYPFVMAAQGISALGPALGGFLNDLTGNPLAGLSVGAGVAVAGFSVCTLLARRTNAS